MCGGWRGDERWWGGIGKEVMWGHKTSYDVIACSFLVCCALLSSNRQSLTCFLNRFVNTQTEVEVEEDRVKNYPYRKIPLRITRRHGYAGDFNWTVHSRHKGMVGGGRRLNLKLKPILLSLLANNPLLKACVNE